VLLDDGTHENFPISRFFWLIQEDIERVSNDRLIRFHSNARQEEWKPTPLGNLKLVERDSISIGEIVMAKCSTFSQTLLGVVLKFAKASPENTTEETTEPSTKAAKKFYFNTLRFQVNKNVEFFLHPCYFLNEDNSLTLNEGFSTLLDKNSYICTVNKNLVDFHNLKVAEEFFESLEDE
jgi:hypothetical protein